METQAKPETCADLIREHATSRLADFREMDAATMSEDEDQRDEAFQCIYEFPLAVSQVTVFRIDISTGGPADWLEVFTDANDPARDGAPVEVSRIVYHYADWFDHADLTLEGEDFETAETFARSLLADFDA